MKRDMDLARQILLQIEAAPSRDSFVSVTSPNHTEAEVSYHVMLLAEAGLIEAHNFSAIPAEPSSPMITVLAALAFRKHRCENTPLT
jgi:hypothetical protein